MIAKVFVEGVAIPPPFHFHDVERKSSEEVLKGSVTNTVTYLKDFTHMPRNS